MSRLSRLLPLCGLAALLLFLLLLTLFGVHKPASFRFPVERGRVYDLVLLEKPGLQERYAFTIQDQDGQDFDRTVGRYELRVPDAGGVAFEVRREARPATRRPLLDPVDLPPLPATPFPRGESTWVTLSESVRRLQGGGGAGGAVGRLVDFSRGDQPTLVDEGCDAAAVVVQPEGRAMAVVRRAGDGHRLEVWVRRAGESWERSSYLAELAPPVDPVWEEDAVWFLERRGDGGAVRRWLPFSGAPPEAVTTVPGAYRLLAAGGGRFWLGGRGVGEFLLAAGTGPAIRFQAHPSLQLLRAYLAPKDAFLVRFPALGREGFDLVLRRRGGESSELIRRLPESVLAASASSDLAVIAGVETCGRRGE